MRARRPREDESGSVNNNPMRSSVQLIPRALMVNSDYAACLLITSVATLRLSQAVIIATSSVFFGALEVDNLQLAPTRG